VRPIFESAESPRAADAAADAATDVSAAAGALSRPVGVGFSHPPAYGRTSSAFWIRLSVRNDTDQADWYLALERARLRSVDLYAPYQGRAQRAGSGIPPWQQPHGYRYPVFPLRLAPGSSATYYLRVHSPDALLSLPLALRTGSEQRSREILETAGLGVYFGIVGVMFLYNLVLLVSLRIRAYFFYTLYLAFVFLSVVIYQGVFPYFVPEDLFDLLQPHDARFLFLSVHLSAVFGVFFVRAFLYPGYSDALDYLGKSVGVALVALLPLHLYEPLLWSVIPVLIALFFIGLPILGIFSGIVRVLRNQISAWYFLMAWTVFLVSLSMLIFEHQGILPYGVSGRSGVLVGSAIEMTLLSVGLADHFRRIELESERVQAASQSKMAFIANMSHEIRTPLNAILGMSELLGEAELKETERGYVSVLRRAGHALLSLINDILDLSKIESGKLELERTTFDLAELTHSTAEIMAPAARERALDFRVNFDPGVPRRVIGDPLRLRQVLLNLLSNAIKFTDEGRVRVEVEPGTHPGLIRFSVRDTGMGIDMGQWDSIFESFVQADESTTRRHGGTGLGLTISRHLVDLMGGRLRVYSVPYKGSDFFFELPLPVGAAPVQVSTLTGEALQIAADARSLKILLVEDNADNQLLFRALLKKLSHRVTIAENGVEAVEMTRSEEFDLIFMDIQMPAMDGLSATRRIREQAVGQAAERVPIYALSAHAMREDVDKSLAAGCDGHLTKPIQRDVLFAVIAQVARGQLGAGA
jgi:hypothetical protein